MPFSDFLLFQSTLLQEERLSCYPEYTLLLHFNPRSYKRSDAYFPCFSCDPVQFQSTLLQEERLSRFLCACELFHISIHAPTRGATPERRRSRTRQRFQSTLLQEERQQKCTIFLMHLCNNYCIVSI